MKKKRLSLLDWQTLCLMHRGGASNQKIADELGVHVGSIGRALKRSGPRNRLERKLSWAEQGRLGFDRDQARRKGKRRRFRIRDAEIRIFIHDNIVTMTPELLSGRMKRLLGKTVCTETIYQYIYKCARELIRFLPVVGTQTRRKKRSSTRQYRLKQPAAPKRSIDERPIEVDARERPGDLELDTVHSARRAQTSDAVLTIIDRHSRFRNYVKLPDLSAETTEQAVVTVLKPLPPALRKTITKDNGPENAHHQQIEEALGCTTYFCHPYSAFERGSVERANRDLRVFFPKGTDFSAVSQDELNHVEGFFNNRPMKCLQFLTPSEVHCDAWRHFAGEACSA